MLFSSLESIVRKGFINDQTKWNSTAWLHISNRNEIKQKKTPHPSICLYMPLGYIQLTVPIIAHYIAWSGTQTSRLAGAVTYVHSTCRHFGRAHQQQSSVCCKAATGALETDSKSQEIRSEIECIWALWKSGSKYQIYCIRACLSSHRYLQPAVQNRCLDNFSIQYQVYGLTNGHQQQLKQSRCISAGLRVNKSRQMNSGTDIPEFGRETGYKEIRNWLRTLAIFNKCYLFFLRITWMFTLSQIHQ